MIRQFPHCASGADRTWPPADTGNVDSSSRLLCHCYLPFAGLTHHRIAFSPEQTGQSAGVSLRFLIRRSTWREPAHVLTTCQSMPAAVITSISLAPLPDLWASILAAKLSVLPK